MKKIIFSIAFIVFILSTSFASTSLVQGSLLNLPNQAGNPSALSNINKMIEYSGYIYAITTDQGIWRISTSDFTGGGGSGWQSFSSGLPQSNPTIAAYYISDMDFSGGYLYAVCSNTTTTQVIYRCHVSTTSTFSNASTSSALTAGEYYIIQAVGSSYVYVSNQSNSTYDIRYSSNSTTTWASLTMDVDGNTPGFIHSTVVVDLSGGTFNLQWCCSNGLFIQNVTSTGAPSVDQGYVSALGNINQMGCVNSSGAFEYGYLSEFSSGPHPYPESLERLITGSGTVYSVTIPSMTGVWISALCTWNNIAHFGVQAFSGDITDVLYVGNSTVTTFSLSTSCTSVSPLNPTPGVICMYGGDASMLLVSVWANGVWYTTNVSCKDGGSDGIADIGDGPNLKVYPQPATSELNVSYTGSDNTLPALTLYDIQGRQQNVPTTFPQAGEAKLDVSSLNKGMYMLEFNNGTKITKRVVID